MKEYEIHANVSYVSGGTRYYNCYLDYVQAASKAEAKRIYKAQLAAEGTRLENVEIVEVEI